MSSEGPKQTCVQALVVFGIILFALAIIGLACPVAALRWDFWILLAIVVVGLLASLILYLFRHPDSPSDEG